MGKASVLFNFNSVCTGITYSDFERLVTKEEDYCIDSEIRELRGRSELAVNRLWHTCFMQMIQQNERVSEAALFSVVLKARGHEDNEDMSSFLMDLKFTSNLLKSGIACEMTSPK